MAKLKRANRQETIVPATDISADERRNPSTHLFYQIKDPYPSENSSNQVKYRNEEELDLTCDAYQFNEATGGFTAIKYRIENLNDLILQKIRALDQDQVAAFLDQQLELYRLQHETDESFFRFTRTLISKDPPAEYFMVDQWLIAKADFTKKENDQLTARQIILLFQWLSQGNYFKFGASDITKIARFLSKISGYSESTFLNQLPNVRKGKIEIKKDHQKRFAAADMSRVREIYLMTGYKDSELNQKMKKYLDELESEAT